MRRIVYCVTAVFTVCLVFSARPLAAQLLFERPASEANVAAYRTIEECLSAIRRVRNSVRNAERTWADTTPMRQDESLAAVAAPVVQTASRCLAQFDSATIPVGAWDLALEGLLHTNRDTVAESLIARRLAMIARTDSAAERTRVAVLDSVIDVYLSVRPLRFNAIERRLRERLASTPSNTDGAFPNLYFLLLRAWDAGRTDLATWSATEYDRLARQAENRCRTTAQCPVTQVWHRTVLDYLARTTLLDSLRRSTAAYVAMKQANAAKASHQTEAPPMAIGKKAPGIRGDFWFDLRQQADTVPVPLTAAPIRPTPGTISLVVFLTNQCRTDGPYRTDATSSPCQTPYAILRRIANRFPKLEITIVSKTAGFYWHLEPMAPPAEAAMLARWWLGYHQIPAVLSVTNTAFVRVDNPDRRRLNEPTPNDLAYTLDGTLDLRNTTMLLIDQNGIVVEAGQYLERTWEPELYALIDVLMTR